ncbi:MAG: T9SS type A sorting domain-containing protein [Tangfeifania sp.]
MRLIFLAITFLIFGSQLVSGQVSQGGRPLEVPPLKYGGTPVIEMPRINNDLIRKKSTKNPDEPRLKNFRFAHGFDVNISPENDGRWTDGPNGYKIWRLKIRSEGAYSLSIIFSDFELPQGAHLFLFNEKTNHYLGAFTSFNNKKTGKFAVSPVAGEEITIQYEVPSAKNSKVPFVISNVNHDYKNILKYSDRRPMGIEAGSCNIDINCDLGDPWNDSKDAVCRIITTKKTGTQTISEICTGTLVNNTAENQNPYVITAAHCIEEAAFAETSVFTFNYESPYCAPLDGDPGNSISGSRLLSISDSLDFALVELSLVPPPDYKPYFAGWNRKTEIPDSTVSIHHPQGDIKKIALDKDKPVISDFLEGYTPEGFLKIERWDAGVTENGSSGGPLFDSDQKLIGTLTGGTATCSNPVRDYFSRFELAWEFKPDSGRQLKYWLDPTDSEISTLQGKRFYENENLCLSFTHLDDEDQHQAVPLLSDESFSGYWGGTNNVGIDEFVERFSIYGNEQLSGISMGIGKLHISNQEPFTEREITLKVYNGNKKPETLIYSQVVNLKALVADAMNFIGFTELVEPADTFFIGFELSNLLPTDSFAVYQSVRPAEKENFFYFKQDGFWEDFKTANTENHSMTNVFELLACNVAAQVNDTALVENPMEALIYPNPARSVFTFETGQKIDPGKISVYNLIGQQVDAKLLNLFDKKIQIDLSGNLPGIYFVRFESESGFISKKVTWAPW